jgi:predicted phosphodiesterase
MEEEAVNSKDIIEELEELFNRVSSIRELYSDYFSRNEYEVKIEFNRLTCSPMIIFSSDVHFGSIYTDYQKLLKIWKTVLERDHIYLAVVGDFIDNFELPVPRLLQSIVNTQIITPALQRDYYVKFLNALIERNKLIACVLGNHENFTPSYPYVQLLREKNIPLAKNRLYLRLKINEQEYRIAFIHRSRFNSHLNPVHSSIMELRSLYPDADIVVTSHTHLPGMMVFPYPRDGRYTERILIRTGSLKADPFQMERYSPYSVSQISTPAIIFAPRSKKMIPFFSFENALELQNISWFLWL